MRILLGVIGVLLIAGLGFLGLRFFGASEPDLVQIEAHVPDSGGAGPLVSAPGAMKLVLPISISFEELTRLANRAPNTQSGVEDDPVKSKNVVEDSLEWQVERGPIAVQPKGEAIEVRTDLTGVVRARGRVQATGGIGNLLGKLNLDAAPFSGQVNIAAEVISSAAPRLHGDWTVTPDLSAQVKMQRADLPIGRLGAIDVRKHVQPALDKAIAKQLKQLRARLSDPTTLQKAVRPFWEKICGTYPVDGADGRVWAEVRPVAVGAASPLVSGEVLEFSLYVMVAVSVGTATQQPNQVDCGPLPESLTVLDGNAAADLQLAFPVLLGWEWLALELNNTLRDPFEEDAGTIRLGGATVSAAQQDQVLIGLDLEFASKKTLLPDVAGRIWLTARPVLDLEANRFRLADIRVTDATQSALGRVKSWSTDRILGLFLERELSVDLDRLEADVLDKADKQIDAFSSGLKGQADVQAALVAARIAEVSVVQGGLSVLVAGQGGIAIKDLRLGFQQ